MRVDIHDLVEELCGRLGVKASYVYRLDLEAGGTATVYLYKGRDGFCKGPKYVVDQDGRPANGLRSNGTEVTVEPAVETIQVPVTA